jgi:glycosyltransferase involved in cell wall biosynthesis
LTEFAQKEGNKILKRTNILVFIGHFIPAYKAGGPIQSISNVVDRLGDKLKINILTSDRDIDDSAPFEGILLDRWNVVGKAFVLYLRARDYTPLKIRSILTRLDYNMVYLNSFFSFRFSILPIILFQLGLVRRTPLIIAPRGEFSPGALGLKKQKKIIFILIARTLGLYHNVTWQASSVHERGDIQRWFGEKTIIVIAKNMPPLINENENSRLIRKKRKGYLKIIFLSRISPKKNLHQALKMLKGLDGNLEFNIFGPIEDASYWSKCQETISDLENNLVVRYRGILEHERVDSMMRGNDIFFLPTLGENYGHVILEALCAGCPVLISDQTPWLELEKKGIGWDIPLQNSKKYHEVLQNCISMDNDEYSKWSEKAYRYGVKTATNNEVVQQHLKLFYRSN